MSYANQARFWRLTYAIFAETEGQRHRQRQRHGIDTARDSDRDSNSFRLDWRNRHKSNRDSWLVAATCCCRCRCCCRDYVATSCMTPVFNFQTWKKNLYTCFEFAPRCVWLMCQLQFAGLLPALSPPLTVQPSHRSTPKNCQSKAHWNLCHILNWIHNLYTLRAYKMCTERVYSLCGGSRRRGRYRLRTLAVSGSGSGCLPISIWLNSLITAITTPKYAKWGLDIPVNSCWVSFWMPRPTPRKINKVSSL